MVDLGQQLRVAMRQSGLTRKQIADQAGVSYSVIHCFAGGTRTMTLDTASRVADLLSVELRPKRKSR